MMRWFILLMLLMLLPSFAQGEEVGARELYDRICTQCHAQEGYVWERSFKAWQASVYSMMDYTSDETDFTKEEADLIIDFLVAHGARLEAELDGEGVVEEDQSPDPEAEPVAFAEALPEDSGNEIVPEPTRPARARFDVSAKAGGYAGVVFLLAAMVSGLLRRTLKRNFRVLHRIAALGLLLVVIYHSAYYLATFGLPNLLWFRMGVGATGILLATGTGVIFRRQFRKVFLKVHATGAFIGLIATILHWVWIYI